MSIKIMTWVWDHSPYEGAALLIHLALADYAGDDGLCYPKQTTIARKSRCSTRYVRDQTKRMERDGYLEIVKPSNGRLSHLYRVVTSAQAVPAELSSGGTVVPVTEEPQFPSHGNHASGDSGTLPPEVTVMYPSSNHDRTVNEEPRYCRDCGSKATKGHRCYL